MWNIGEGVSGQNLLQAVLFFDSDTKVASCCFQRIQQKVQDGSGIPAGVVSPTYWGKLTHVPQINQVVILPLDMHCSDEDGSDEDLDACCNGNYAAYDEYICKYKDLDLK